MSKYLVTWSNERGVHEHTFSDYQEALEFMADIDGQTNSIAFSQLSNPDDERGEAWDRHIY